MHRFPHLLKPPVPRRIPVGKRIVVGVAVAIQPLAAEGSLNERVRGEEPPQDRIVFPRVHVDKPHFVVHLVTREATGGGAGDGGSVGPVGVAAFAVGIIGEVLHDVTRLIGDGIDRAQVVGVEVARVAGAITVQGVDTHDDITGIEVMLLRHRRAAGDALVELADVDRGAAGIGLDETVEAGVISQGVGLAVGGDGIGLIKRGVGDGFAIAGEHVAVNIVSETRIQGPRN